MTLSRRTIRAIKELEGVKLTTTERVAAWFDDNVLVDKVRNGYHNIKTFLVNLIIFVPMAWRWRSWDYDYNLEVFTKLLDETGKHIIKHGNTVNSKKVGRRALIASAKLKKAYGSYDNKTAHYLYERHGFSVMKNYKPKVSERILNGMLKVANKREDSVVEERKKEAWSYVAKYIEYFWD